MTGLSFTSSSVNFVLCFTISLALSASPLVHSMQTLPTDGFRCPTYPTPTGMFKRPDESRENGSHEKSKDAFMSPAEYLRHVHMYMCSRKTAAPFDTSDSRQLGSIDIGWRYSVALCLHEPYRYYACMQGDSKSSRALQNVKVSWAEPKVYVVPSRLAKRLAARTRPVIELTTERL